MNNKTSRTATIPASRSDGAVALQSRSGGLHATAVNACTAFQERAHSTGQGSEQPIGQAMAINTPRDRWRQVQSAHDALAGRLDLALSRSQTKPPEFIGATFGSRLLRLFTTFDGTFRFTHQPRYDASERRRSNRGQ